MVKSQSFQATNNHGLEGRPKVIHDQFDLNSFLLLLFSTFPAPLPHTGAPTPAPGARSPRGGVGGVGWGGGRVEVEVFPTTPEHK